MIVDDNREVLKSLALWLKSEGFEPYTARNFQRARDLVQKIPFSVALVDLRMNDMDGIRITEKLLELDEHLKIIIITGFPSYESATMAMKAGAFDYLSKGTTNDIIINVIHKAIRANRRELGMEYETDLDESSTKFILICQHPEMKELLEAIAQGNQDLKFVADYSSLAELKDRIPGGSVDIALICAQCIPKQFEGGLHFFSDLATTYPTLLPVVINDNLSEQDQVRLLKQGARGFCSPHMNIHQLEQAITLVKQGQIWAKRQTISASLQQLIDERKKLFPPSSGRIEASLTKREKEVLRAIAKGKTNREIADLLLISEKTVKTHTHHIFKKMGVDNRSKAILKAMKHKIS
ncbi:MAG: response regulator [Candidatus Aminicenantaceae bacterium]